MYSLGLLILFCVFTGGFLLVLWRLRRTLAGACLSVALLLFASFLLSFVYWVHYYMGYEKWPQYLTWSLLGGSALAFLCSLVVKLWPSH